MTTFEAADFYHLDDLLTPAECRLRDDVRQWVDARFLPIVAEHYRDGTFPLELMPELAALGVFGPGIKGYGCAGLGSVALTEPDFGSNPGGMHCRAVKTSHGYRLNGAKKWIGNGTIADVVIVWAKVEGDDDIDPASGKAV